MEEKLFETNLNSLDQISQLPSLVCEELEQDRQSNESFEAYDNDNVETQQEKMKQDNEEPQDIILQSCSQDCKPDQFQNLVEMLEKVETLKLLSQTAPCDYYRAISEQCSFKKFTKGDIIFLKNERKVGFYGLIEGRVALWQPKSHVEIEEELKQLHAKKSTLHSGTNHSSHHSNSSTSNKKPEIQKDEQFIRILLEGAQGERFFVADERQQNTNICNQKLIGIFGQGSSFNEQEVLTGERAGGTLLAVEECLMVVIKREEFTKIFAQQILKLRFVKEVLFSVFSSPGNKKAAESLERVSGYFREFQFEYQNTIFEEGAQSDEFYVIHDGEIQKFHALKNVQPSSPLSTSDQISNELPLFPSSERRIKRSETKGGIIAKGGLLGLSDCILNIPRNHSARCISARASLFAIKRSKFLQVLFDNEDYGLLEQVKKLANAQQKLSLHLINQPPFVLGPDLTPKRTKEINSPSQLLNASLQQN